VTVLLFTATTSPACAATHLRPGDDAFDAARDGGMHAVIDAASVDAHASLDAGRDASRDVGRDAPWLPPDAFEPPCDDASAVLDAPELENDAARASGRITVVLRDLSHRPLAGRPVVFHDAAGVPIDVVRADTTGTASSSVPGIVAITAVVDEPTLELRTTTRLYTLSDVEPNDTIVFDWPITQRNVVVPPYPWPTSYTSYDVATPLDVRNMPTMTAGTVTLWDAAGPASVTATVDDGSDRGTSSIGFVDADTITLSPWVLFAGGQVRYDFAVAGCPAPQVFAELYAGTVAARFLLDVGGNDATSGSLGARRTAPDVPIFVSGEWSDGTFGARITSYEVIARALPYPAPPTMLDARTAPAAQDVVFTHATHAVDWTAPTDVYLARLDLNYATAMLGGANWRIVTASPRHHLAPPSLPPELAAYEIDPSSTSPIDWSITFDATDCVRDADAFRAHPFGPFDRGCWGGGTTTVSDVFRP
jgi:hypothetical protein